MDYKKQEHSPYSRFASASEIKENLYKVDFNGKAEYGGIPLFCENGEVYIDHTGDMEESYTAKTFIIISGAFSITFRYALAAGSG